MRHAPPVSVLCHGRFWRLVQAAVYCLTAAILAAWLASHLAETPVGRVGILLSAVLAGGACLFLALRLIRPTPVELSWDGRQWLLDARPLEPELMLQSRRFLLLRLRGQAARSTWLGVERGEAAVAWHGLLVALRARSTPPVAEGLVG